MLKREKFSHINLLKELKLDPRDWLLRYLRMVEHTYFELLNLVTSLIIKKKNTKLRETISPHGYKHVGVYRKTHTLYGKIIVQPNYLNGYLNRIFRLT
jgi:hypothetical protein